MTDVQENVTDMNSADVHQDVDLLLECSNRDILELISTDPKYYLDIVTRYTKRPDGQEIFLPYLFNITIVRNTNEFRIKFKISDDSEWHEVGFAGGEFSDQDVYDAFTKKVRYALERPSNHRALILDSLRFDSQKKISPHPSENLTLPNQGDQTKLSKIDRFMNRRAPVVDIANDSLLGPDVQLSPEPIITTSSDPISFIIQPAVDLVNDACKSTESSKSTESIKTPISEGRFSDWFVPPSSNAQSAQWTTFDILKTICPDNMMSKYVRLLEVLNSQDTFYQSLIKELPYMSPGKRLLTTDFLLNNF